MLFELELSGGTGWVRVGIMVGLKYDLELKLEFNFFFFRIGVVLKVGGWVLEWGCYLGWVLCGG